MRAVSEGCFHRLFYRLEIASNQSSNMASIGFVGNRHIRAKYAFAVRDIELPSNPEESEPLFKQESIAEIGVILRIRTSRSEIKERQHAFISAIGYFVQHGTIAAARIFRFDE